VIGDLLQTLATRSPFEFMYGSGGDFQSALGCVLPGDLLPHGFVGCVAGTRCRWQAPHALDQDSHLVGIDIFDVQANSPQLRALTDRLPLNQSYRSTWAG
jgi:hypothetical protein